MRDIHPDGLELVKKWEGIMDGDPTTLNLDPYIDPVGIWTIGWGHAIRDPASAAGSYLRGPAAKATAFALYPGGITRAQAETLLKADLLDAARDVEHFVKVPLTDLQFAALCSFEFNCGGLRRSTLLKLLNAGDYSGAAAQFNRWVTGLVDGERRTLPGLVSRRRDERRLFELA